MATDLAIVNKALSLLGEGLLTAGQLVTPDDDKSRTVAAVFDMARKAVLRDSRPQCARKYATLALTVSPAANPDFLYSFDVPADSLRVLTVFSAESGTSVIEGIGAVVVTRWRIAGGKLLTDVGAAACEYIYDAPTTTFDPLTDEAMAYYLAWQLALPLTESRTTAADMNEQYLIAQQRLQATNENEGQIDRYDAATRLTAVRRW